jgi:hypothetical protein
MQGVNYIKDLFPNKIVKEFDLVKSKIELRQCLAFRLLFSTRLEHGDYI